MHRYTLFLQHQYGIFNAQQCTDQTVGTIGVGPCIAFFLYHPEKKSCLAVHIDLSISINAIKKIIREFLPGYKDIQKCRAILVGGWQSVLKDMQEEAIGMQILEFLTQMKVLHINTENLYVHRGWQESDCYAGVLLNLASGVLTIHKRRLDFIPDYDPKMRANTMHLLGSKSISMILDTIKKSKSTGLCSNETRGILDSLIQEDDGTPIMPFHNFYEQTNEQLSRLRKTAILGDAVEMMRLLYIVFVNPTSPISSCNDNTPLHYATYMLNQDPNNFERKVIVLMLVLSGKQDSKNSSGELALDRLHNPSLLHIKNRCQEIIKFFADLSGNNEVKMDKVIMYCEVFKFLILDTIFVSRNNKQQSKTQAEEILTEGIQTVLQQFETEAELEKTRCPCSCVIA